MIPVVRDVVTAVIDEKSYSMEMLHKCLGHVCVDMVHRTAKFYGWKLRDKETQCEACDIAKARQGNLNKEPVARSKVPGERLFINISSTEAESYRRSKYWLLVIDDTTDYCWSLFLKSKDETAECMIELIKELNDRHRIVVK